MFDKHYHVKEAFIELGVTQQVYQFKKDVDGLYKGEDWLTEGSISFESKRKLIGLCDRLVNFDGFKLVVKESLENQVLNRQFRNQIVFEQFKDELL